MACGPRDIYNALLAQGFSTDQAIGAMANGIAESGLNPETRVVDSNGYYSNGIWQFNEASYPNSGSLVTGNCTADISAQVGLLKASVSGQALAGAGSAQVAGNFAQYFERCQECGPGGASYQQRVANSATVAGWVQSGKWPTSSAGLSGTGSAAAAAASGPDCAFSLGGQHVGVILGKGPTLPDVCLLKKATIRHAAGVGLMVWGGGVGLVGILVLAAFAFRASGAGRAASAVLGAVPTPGAQAASKLVASPQAAARSRVSRQQAAARQQQQAAARAQKQTVTPLRARGPKPAVINDEREGRRRSPPATGAGPLKPIRKRPPNYRPPAERGAVKTEFHHDD